MVIVMDMSTGRFEKLASEEALALEFGPFADEVLNAGWLPQPQLRLETYAPSAAPKVAGRLNAAVQGEVGDGEE